MMHRWPTEQQVEPLSREFNVYDNQGTDLLKMMDTEDQHEYGKFIKPSPTSSLASDTWPASGGEKQKDSDNVHDTTASQSAPSALVRNSWREQRSASGKKKKRSYNFSWEEEYPWVQFDESDNTMKCMWCVKTCQQNSFVTGSANFQKSALVRHEKTDHHKAASADMRLEEVTLSVTGAPERSSRGFFAPVGTAPIPAPHNVPDAKFSSVLHTERIPNRGGGATSHTPTSVTDDDRYQHRSQSSTSEGDSHKTQPVADNKHNSLFRTPASEGKGPSHMTTPVANREHSHQALKTSVESPTPSEGGDKNRTANAVAASERSGHAGQKASSRGGGGGATSHVADSLPDDVVLDGGFLQGHVLQRWQRVALEQGLKSDDEIAAYLLNMYEVPQNSTPRTVASETKHLCSSCQTPLTLVCLTCNPGQAKCETVSLQRLAPSTCDSAAEDSKNTVTRLEKEGLLSAVGLRATRSSERKLNTETKAAKNAQTSWTRSRSSKGQQRASEGEQFVLPEPADEGGEDAEVEDRPFKCSICSKAFKSRAHCHRHETTHREEKSHKCDKCPAAFHNSHNLKVHYRKHTGERPFFCQICQKTFARSGALKRHKLTHSSSAPFKCEWCGDMFKDQNKLLAHCCKEHKLERPYRCNQCEATFVQKRHLNSHLMKHSNPRPFLCEECGASFKHKVVLTAHKRIHKGIRPFTCDECGQSFYRQENLRGHQKTHLNIRNYVCTVCGAAFLRNNTLKRHMQSKHTNIRPFQCSECGKTFKFKFDLKNHHLSVHSVDKPYTCDVCGQLFSLLGNMRKHRKRLHPHAPPLVSSNQQSGTQIQGFG